jgi:hypothetical protein
MPTAHTTPIHRHEIPAVRLAYASRAYTDRNGDVWRLGMDGWFLDDAAGPGTVMLVRHHEFVAIIEKEHPPA